MDRRNQMRIILTFSYLQFQDKLVCDLMVMILYTILNPQKIFRSENNRNLNNFNVFHQGLVNFLFNIRNNKKTSNNFYLSSQVVFLIINLMKLAVDQQDRNQLNQHNIIVILNKIKTFSKNKEFLIRVNKDKIVNYYQQIFSIASALPVHHEQNPLPSCSNIQINVPETRRETRNQFKTKEKIQKYIEQENLSSMDEDDQSKNSKQNNSELKKSQQQQQQEKQNSIQKATRTRTGVAKLKSDNKKEKEKENQNKQLKQPVVKITKQKEQEKQNEEQGAFKPCICSKTNCLQMYCQCFHNGRFCVAECICNECMNNESHNKERENAINHIKNKAKRIKKSEDNLFNTKTIESCKCRQTHCLKRYCECFLRGQKCTDKCDCENCENGQEEYIREQELAKDKGQLRNNRNRSSEDFIVDKLPEKKRR